MLLARPIIGVVEGQLWDKGTSTDTLEAGRLGGGLRIDVNHKSRARFRSPRSVGMNSNSNKNNTNWLRNDR